jgi:hypothetical protein
LEPPDRLENGIRFGCGFLFGGFIAVAALITSLLNRYYIAACVLTAGLVCGYTAMRYGDRFWDHVRRWWWWT